MSYHDDFVSIWESVKLSLKEKYAPSFVNLWFEELKFQSFENNKITFSTISELKYNFITENHLPLLKKEFSLFLGFEPEIELVFLGQPVTAKDIMDSARRQDALGGAEEVRKKADIPTGIIPQNYKFDYTFENFIVGNSNKFAHAACTAVAAHPAENYNPLFIYGPSGLGKTHLLSAVVNEIKKNKPSTRVLYIKGDDFTNQMIVALGEQQMPEFREKYRNCDVLLIDDIQFIAGKTSTQEEFFHTFNTLYEDGKQIILTSDRPPKDIKTLEDRLKTRFEWGLLADIQPPDIELRVAIIRKKAEQVALTLPDEVLNFIAENLCSNIRQIEGVIKKLKALSFLQNKPITMEIAKSCITEFLGGAEPVNVTIEKIFSSISSRYGVSKGELTGKKRTKEIASARHLSVYVIREITEMSYPSIAKIFDRDYATIHASFELVSKKYDTDPIFKIEVDELIREITG
ncbi:MAG: chromosomal replication initiator protein DnaA [Clostridia bacterium]|nr:chromosomal replication initiator protein DnaA [Clostridia bacterium]